MTTNERTVQVKSDVPAYLIWDAAKHAKSEDVSIRLRFVNINGGGEWLFFNRDVCGVRHYSAANERTLMIYFKRGIKILFDTHLREGVLIERR